MINKTIFGFAILAFLVLSGCSGKPISFGSSDKMVNRDNIDFTKGREVSASASGLQLLLFIPIKVNNRHERAFNILRTKARGDYLTDIKIQESWRHYLFGTEYKTKFEAMVYPYKK